MESLHEKRHSRIKVMKPERGSPEPQRVGLSWPLRLWRAALRRRWEAAATLASPSRVHGLHITLRQDRRRRLLQRGAAAHLREDEEIEEVHDAEHDEHQAHFRAQS